MILLDCNAICYQAHYTTRTLTASDGTPTGIIYGFFQQLRTIVEQVSDARLVFCWDSRHSLRKERCATYKANRDKKRKEDPTIFDSMMQFEELRTVVLPSLGVQNNFMVKGYEADDLIAYFCKKYHTEKDFIIIASNDQDLYQLLGKNVSMYKPSKGVFYTRTDFRKEYDGIVPGQWAHLKAIVGCPSDNVIGIRGVGEKTAVKWLSDSECYIQKIDCEEGQRIIKANYPLVHLPLKGLPDMELYFKKLDYEKWKEFCVKYEFQSFLKDRFWADLFTLKAPVGFFAPPAKRKRHGKR